MTEVANECLPASQPTGGLLFQLLGLEPAPQANPEHATVKRGRGRPRKNQPVVVPEGVERHTLSDEVVEAGVQLSAAAKSSALRLFSKLRQADTPLQDAIKLVQARIGATYQQTYQFLATHAKDF